MSPRGVSSSIWTLAILNPSAVELAPLAPIVAAVVRAHLERGTFEFRDAAITLWSYATLGDALPMRVSDGRALHSSTFRLNLSMFLWDTSCGFIHLQ